MTGLTQTEFAKAVHVGKPSIQSWEADNSRPSKASLQVLAMECEVQWGVPVSWLLASDERLAGRAPFATHVGARMRHYTLTGEDPYGDFHEETTPGGGSTFLPIEGGTPSGTRTPNPLIACRTAPLPAVAERGEWAAVLPFRGPRRAAAAASVVDGWRSA